MKKNWIFSFLDNALWIIACIVTVFLFGINFFYTVDITYDTWEQVTISGHLLSSLIMLAAALVMVVILVFCRKVTKFINEKTLFIALSAIYIFLGFYLILNSDSTLGADPKHVHTAALNFLDGNYIDFATEGYIHRYPHQLGLLLYDTLIARFCRDAQANFFMNLLFVLGINFFTYKIADQLFKNKTVNIMTMLVSFAFLPQLIFILFAYGLIPGFFFMMLAFYAALKFTDGYKIRHLLILVVGSIGAILMKNNYLIGVIAIIIFLLLKLLKDNFHWKNLVAMALLILCLFLPQKIITAIFEAQTDAELEDGAPAILWIAMGTDIDNHMRTAGWYDGTNYSIYTDSYHDGDIAAYYGKLKMKNNLEKMKANPALTWDFFQTKTISQWCDPMHGSVFVSVPDHVKNWELKYPAPLVSLYSAQEVDNRITVLSKYISLIVWGFAAAFFIIWRKKCFGWEMFFSFTIGGLIFHTFWEGKSQYIHPYLFVMIPFAMFALWMVVTKLRGLLKRKKKNEEV